MKKPRHLDHDGLDGILPTAARIQSKFENPKFRPDKAPAKSTRGKVSWLLGGLGVLLLSGVLVKIALQTSATSTQTVKEVVNMPISLAQPEAARDLDANVSQTAETGNLPAGQVSADRQATESELLAALPTEPTAAGIAKAPVNTGDQANATAPFTLYFAFDSARLSRLSAQQTTGLLGSAKACQGSIKLVGHTCNLGPGASNLLLGQARAGSVKKWLIRNGIAAERILAASEGMSKPVAPNDTKAGQALNRRVELYCLDH